MKSKVALISGGAKNLGAHLAAELVKDGFIVHCISRTGTLPSGIDPVSGSAQVVDITDPQACEDAIAKCIDLHGSVDVLINNASGFFGGVAIGDYQRDAFQNELSVTLLGAMQLTNAFARSLADQTGSRRKVIFISSISGVPREAGNELYCGYAAAKAGLIRFSESIQPTLALKDASSHVLIPDNIRTHDFESESAVSYGDVSAAVRFLLAETDNLVVSQMILEPFRTRS